MYRIVLCVDVNAATPEEAYKKVHDAMTRTAMSWGSSDEWFDPDGNPLSFQTVLKARLAAFKGLYGCLACPHDAGTRGGICDRCGAEL